jgi:uncharacterized protein (DUF58 family)
MHLRPRLVAAVALGGLLVAVVPAPTWAAATVVAAILISIIVSDVVAAPPAGTLLISREVPTILRLGRPATVSVRVHNPTAGVLRVEAHDATPPSMERRPRRHDVTIEPGGWIDLPATLHPARRGRVRLGPITVRTGGPLGLAGRQGALSILDEVKVYPALHARADIELRLRRARLLQTGQRSSAIRGGGSEFDSLRDYRPDDEFRQINWRATARSRRAIANEYREEHNQQVLILLDASRATAGQVEGVSRLEHALDAAIAVGELAARVGDHVGAVAFAREVLASVDARGGRVQTRRILDLLFDVQPRLDAADYPGAFGTILRRNRRRSWLVLFSDLSETSVLEPLLRAIPILLVRHLVVVAAVRDPALGSVATMPPHTSEEAYAAAAAAGFLMWRDRAAATIRRLGGVCIDRPPQELAAAVADEYLRVKSLGLL